MARSVKAVRRHHVHVKSAHSRKAKGRLAQRKRERKLNWQLNTVNSDGSAPKKIQVSTSAREQKQNVLSPEEIEERAQKRLLKKQQKELDRQAASTSAAQANELRRQQKEERRARQAEEGAKKVEEAARKREEAKAAAAAAAAEAAAKANEAKQQRKAEEEQRRKQKAESPVKEKPPADESASSKGSKKNKKEKEESAKVNDDAAPAEPNKANDANVEEPEVQVSRVDASEGAKPDAGKKKEKKSKKHQDSATFEREATPVAETEPVQNVFAAPTNDQPAAVDNQEVTAPKDDSKKKSKKQKSKSPEVDVVTAAAAAEPEPQTVAAETQEQAVVDTNGTPTNEPLEVETLSKSAEETAVEDAPVAKFSQQNGHEESVPTPQGVEVGEEALEDVQKVDRHQEAEQPSKKNKKKGKNQRVSESEGQTDNSDNVKPAEAPIDNAQVEEAKSSETSPAEQAAEVQQTAEVQENAEPATESKEGGHSKKDKKNKGKKHQESESGAPHEAENVNDQEAVAEEVHEKKKGKKDKKKHESETEAAPQEEVAVAAAPIESGPSVIEEKANPVFTTEKAPEEFDFFDFLPEKKPAVDETSAPEVTAPSDAPEQESAPSKETEEVAVPNKNTQDVVEEKPKQCFVTEKAPEDFDFFDFLPEKKSETTVDVAAASEEVSAPSESSKAETAAVDASASEEAAAPSEKSTVEPGLVDAGTPEKIAAPSESVQNAVEEKPKQCFVTEKAPEDFDFFDFLPEKKSETTVDDAEALVEVTENADNAKAVAEEANYAEAPADETPEEGSKKSKKGKKDKKHRESEGESAPQETTLPHENVEAVVDEQVSQAEVALDEAPEEGSKKSRKGKKDKKHRQSETESTPHDAAVPNENAGAVAEEANYAVDAAADEGFEDGSKKSKKGKKDKKHRESETEAGHQEVHVSNETAQVADEQPNNVEAAADEPHEDGPKKSRRGKRGRHEKQASKETTPVDDSAAVYEPVEVTPSQPDVVAAPEADYAAAVSEEATGDVHDKAEEGHGDFETKKGKRTRHHKKHGSKEATPVEAEGASGPNHEDEHAESGTVNVDETAEPEPVAHEDEHKSKDSKKGKHRKQKSSESNEVADAPAPEHTEGGKHKRGGGRRGRNSNSRTSESSQPGDVPAEEEPSHVQEPIAEEQEKKGADDHEHGHQKHRRGKKGKHQNHDEEPLEKLQTSLGPVDGELGNQKVNGDSAASPSEDFVVVRYERNEFAEPPPSESSPAQSPEIVEDGFEVVNTGKQQGKKGGKKGKKFEQQLANALEIAAEVEGTTKTTAPDLAPNGFQEEFLIDNFVNEDEQHGKKKKNKRGKNASQSEEKLVPGQTELKEAPLDVATETTQEEKEPSSPPLQVNEVSSTAHEDSNGSQAASGAQSPVTETITAQAEISQEDAESPTKFAQNVQRLVESTIGTVDPTKKLTINAQLIKLAEKKPPVILFESKPVVLAIERHSQSPKFEQRSFRDRVYKLLPKDILFCAGMLDKYGEDFDAMAKDASNVYKETPRSLQRKIRIFRESPHFEVYQKAKAEGRELSELLH